VSPTVGINCCGLWLVLRVGVLKDVKNNGNTRDTRVLDRIGPPWG
jgi:hypothetical protein